MDVVLQFESNTSSQQLTFVLTVFIATVAFGGLLFLLKKKPAPGKRNQNMLVAMLLFFAFLIAASTAFFSKWSSLKTGTVSIYPDKIETGYGTASFDHIKKIYLEDNELPSMINPTIKRKTVKMLLIEETEGKIHILSEENYDINDIFRSLKKTIEQWESGKN